MIDKSAVDKKDDETNESQTVQQQCESAISELASAEAKAADNWERLLRAQAELDNIKRRSEREIANAHKFSLDKFAKELLPVVDSLEMALQTSPTEDLKTVFSGIELTHKMLLDALQKQGIKQLNPMGELFNPQQHEAVTTQTNADMEPNTITLVMQKGYTLYDRLIRPALVAVSIK